MNLKKGPLPQFTEEEIQAVTQALVDSFTNPRDQLIDNLVLCALNIDKFRKSLKANPSNVRQQEIIIFCFEQWKNCAKILGQYFNYHHKGTGREVCSLVLNKTKQLFDRVVIKQLVETSDGNQCINIGILLKKFPIEQNTLITQIKYLLKKAQANYKHEDPKLLEILALYIHQINRLGEIYCSLVEPKLVQPTCSTESRQSQANPSLFQRVLSFFPSSPHKTTRIQIVTSMASNDDNEINPLKIETMRC